MKKLILTLFLISSFVTYAQTTFGVKAGLSISKVNDINGESEERIAPFFGGFATIPVADNDQFFVQPELIYNMLGEKNGDTKFNLDYISVPVLFKAYFSENDTEFFGEVGPQFGFLINKNVAANQKDLEYNTFDLGATVGVGFSYLRNWEANIRFMYGFMDAVKDDPIDAHNFNSNLSFGVGYRF